MGSSLTIKLKKAFTYLILVCSTSTWAQQTTNYIQYIFAKGVVNPAASGTNINQKYYYTFGSNRQWVNFDNAPKSNFGNVSFTIRPPRSYSYWQNVGVTIENEQSGILTYNGFYANYTIHLLLRKNLIASFGVNAGFRKFFLSNGLIDPNDPVLQKTTSHSFAYPDIVPGFRLSNKKFFFDISAKQISINQQKDPFTNHQIGSPSKLNPTIFMAYGRVFPISENWIMLPSVGINMAFISPPSVAPTLMFYYANRFGFGLAARNLSFTSAIFQVRILENLSVGLCYSYSINETNVAAPNSYEIMIGVAPMGLGNKTKGRRSVAKCPALDF